MATRTLTWFSFVLRTCRRFAGEGFGQLSASLSFTTLLSLVPLIAVILGMASVLPAFSSMVDHLDQFVARNLLPEGSAGVIVKYVLKFSQKAAKVTTFGLLALVVTVYLLLVSVEKAFNRVWQVAAPRSLHKRVWVYALVLVLWPLLMGTVLIVLTYALTASLGLVQELSWLRGTLFKLAGLPVAAIGFSLLYFFVPNAHVRMRDAWWAGLLVASLLLLMQKAFGLYLANVPSYAVVYGTFAAVPIFLIWVYLSWAVVLLGAFFAAALPEFRQGKASRGRDQSRGRSSAQANWRKR